MSKSKYALVNEQTGQVVEHLVTEESIVAVEAFALADLIRPNWRREGLKLWLRVGGQQS